MNKNITIGAGLGGVCLWSTRRQLRSAVVAAADAAGIGRFVPPQPAVTTTLRDSMLEHAVNEYGRRRKQPIVVRRLDEPNAFEAVRVVPSLSRNTYNFLFSASITPEWEVKVLDDASHRGDYHTQALRDLVDVRRMYLPGPAITQVMVKALRSWHGLPLKEDGGAWFLDGQYLDRYRAFAAGVRGVDGPRFTVHQIEIASDPDTVSHVLELLRDDVSAGLRAIMEDVEQAQGGMSDRSIGVRITRANQFLAKVQQYEALMGKPLPDLTDAIEQTKTAVAVNRLLATSV